MTNKDKFLRDGVSAEEFIQNLTNHINKTQKSTYEKIKEFLEQPAQILTEDERIILKNIPVKEKYIMRDSAGQLWTGKNPLHRLFQFEYLFQFIKEGESYEIKELLENE